MTVYAVIGLCAVACLATGWFAIHRRPAQARKRAAEAALRDLYGRYLAGVRAATQEYLRQAPSDKVWLTRISARVTREEAHSGATGAPHPDTPAGGTTPAGETGKGRRAQAGGAVTFTHDATGTAVALAPGAGDRRPGRGLGPGGGAGASSGPGWEAPAASNSSRTASMLAAPVGPGDKRSIFVVSGRDTEATASLVQMLRALGLSIIEWGHAVRRVGSPNPHIGDVVFAGLQLADAALIVLTPDDLVQLRPDLLQANDGYIERELHGQARPNAFYEAGIADAYSRERTIIVQIGATKSFSDIQGRSVIQYNGSAKDRNELVERLRIAGLQPDSSGRDWLTAGDVIPSITKAQRAITSARHLNRPSK